MKRCSTSLIIRAIKIQNHNKVIIHLSDIQIKTRLTIPSVGKNVEQLKLSYTTGKTLKNYTTSLENSLTVSLS